MGFEAQGDTGSVRSPGGFEFGIVGWTYGPPTPRSITFFLDNTAVVCDQYGRCIRAAVMPDGREVRFAPSAPEANRENAVEPRPQYATHVQVIEALVAERINWLAYAVRWRTKTGQYKDRLGLGQREALDLQMRLIQEGNSDVVVVREVACAGWPQLPYARLKELPELPPTPKTDLLRILDPVLRRDALRIRREADEARERDLQPTVEE